MNKFDNRDSLGNQSRAKIALYLFTIWDWKGALSVLFARRRK